jgi:hypothetical protein
MKMDNNKKGKITCDLLLTFFLSSTFSFLFLSFLLLLQLNFYELNLYYFVFTLNMILSCTRLEMNNIISQPNMN